MLQLDNRTPFAAERTIVMDKHGEKSWVVAVRGTYIVQPNGNTVLASEQSPPLYSPEFNGEPGASSIGYEADLIPGKAATDVLVNGSAYAPGGKPARSVDVRLRVGVVDKRLTVSGDRCWSAGPTGLLGYGAPARFDRMPITYERSFGGWDRTDPEPSRQRLYRPNPIGSGFAIEARHLEGRPLPNVEVPSHLISSWKDRPPPGGFGSIASHWSPRIESAGTYDQDWMARKFPLLPDDFDGRFHQSAPLDQRVDGHLRGGEAVMLENLTEDGVLRFQLPKVYLSLFTLFGKKRIEHRASLQTVVIEPDVPRVVMVWQSSLACHHLLDWLDVTVVRQKTYL